MSRQGAALLAALVIGLAACSSDASPSAQPSLPPRSDNVELVASLPRAEHSFEFAHTDLAFWGELLVQGSYDGFRLVDISDPASPELLAEVACRGPQGDVSIWEDLVFVSVDRPQSSPACDSQDAARADPLFLPDDGGWEGVRVFNISSPARPELVASVATDCGSLAHTLVPDEARNRVLLYVTSFATELEPRLAPGCVNPHGHISVVEVPLGDPEAARVVSRPHLFDTPALPVPPGAPPNVHPSVGCEDVAVNLALRLAAAACRSEGQVWDLSNLERPMAIAHVDDPSVGVWSSAAWSGDGSLVAFGDASPADACADGGALLLYSVTDPRAPEAVGRFSPPRTPGGGECSAGLAAGVPGTDLLTAAWLSGGASLLDVSDPANPREVAWYDAEGDPSGDAWAAYWYRGHLYVSDRQRGLEVVSVDEPALAGAAALDRLNPQTTE
ncbi:MAG TPA: hypothetical protein VFH63_05220 [candidate division Zixibacteria bacterium]|nr:hypothetical protein [candidate division Zixibacteria bacterium]